MSADTEQWALVTGASGGIGHALALALARRGYAVLVSGRSSSALERVVEACRAGGAPRAAACAADLSDPVEVERLAQHALEVTHDGARLDVLVNNAGVVVPGNAVEGDPDAWERMLAVNLAAPMRLTRRLAPAMVRRERGAIINIASFAGIDGHTERGAYAATKFGLRGWSLSTHKRLRRHGVKVVVINPALVDTELVRDFGARPERMMRPEDVAAAAMLALSTSDACCPRELTLHLTRPAYD